MMKIKNRYFFRKKVTPWLILLIPIVFTIWLKYYPILNAVFISFFDYNPINSPGKFVGLKNYQNLFSANYYWEAWANTIIFIILQILMTFFTPIIQALFLNEIKLCRGFLSTVYILPVLIPTTINVIIWRWVWHPDYGIANLIVTAFGGQAQTWLSDPNLVKFCIIFPGVIGGGIGVLLYLSAIQGIPNDIIESALLDGCTGWKKIWYIILPNIRFIIFIQLVIAIAAAIQLLDAPYLFASGGPSGASTTQGIYIFNAFKQELNYGKGAAASVLLMIVAMIMTIFQMHFEKSERA